MSTRKRKHSPMNKELEKNMPFEPKPGSWDYHLMNQPLEESKQYYNEIIDYKKRKLEEKDRTAKALPLQYLSKKDPAYLLMNQPFMGDDSHGTTHGGKKRKTNKKSRKSKKSKTKKHRRQRK